MPNIIRKKEKIDLRVPNQFYSPSKIQIEKPLSELTNTLKNNRT